MQVTYIGHSGFLIELPDIYLLFDYFQGEIPKLDKGKELFIFASHFHKDHYNKEILSMYQTYEKSHFVTSKDIRIQKDLQRKYGEDIDLENRAFRLGANTTTEIGLQNQKMIRIETFKSTDAGVAYLVTYDGKTIYHAGDLNLWIWAGESKQYNQDMTKKFMTQMDLLKERDIDVAFLPLDPRQEQDSDKGMEIFLDVAQTKHVFPMHCWEEYEIIERFKQNPKHQKYVEQIYTITKPGEVFNI